MTDVGLCRSLCDAARRGLLNAGRSDVSTSGRSVRVAEPRTLARVIGCAIALTDLVKAMTEGCEHHLNIRKPMPRE